MSDTPRDRDEAEYLAELLVKRPKVWAPMAANEIRALLAAREADAARIAKCRGALQQMLEHSGVADADPDMKDERDHAAETAALSALRATDGDPTDE